MKLASACALGAILASTGQGLATTTGSINQIDRATPDSQAQGKANAAKQ